MVTGRTKTQQFFVWTEDEVGLLLDMALNYKTTKCQENADWKSCQPCQPCCGCSFFFYNLCQSGWQTNLEIVDLYHLKDHNHCQTVRVSARLAQRKPRVSRCPCCASEVDSKHHRPAPAPPQKRKRTSAGRASTSPALAKKHRAVIPPEDLPEVSPMVPSPRPSTDLQQGDGPLQIHQLSVDSFTSLYVVETDLRNPSICQRPYTKALGLHLKHKLWRSLNHPTFMESVDETGRVQVNVSYEEEVYPPCFDVDVSGETLP